MPVPPLWVVFVLFLFVFSWGVGGGAREVGGGGGCVGDEILCRCVNFR